MEAVEEYVDPEPCWTEGITYIHLYIHQHTHLLSYSRGCVYKMDTKIKIYSVISLFRQLGVKKRNTFKSFFYFARTGNKGLKRKTLKNLQTLGHVR